MLVVVVVRLELEPESVWSWSSALESAGVQTNNSAADDVAQLPELRGKRLRSAEPNRLHAHTDRRRVRRSRRGHAPPFPDVGQATNGRETPVGPGMRSQVIAEWSSWRRAVGSWTNRKPPSRARMANGSRAMAARRRCRKTNCFRNGLTQLSEKALVVPPQSVRTNLPYLPVHNIATI